MFACVEMLLTLTLRPLYDRGIKWPLMLFGIVAVILQAVGLLPPYQELWKSGGRVVGVHFGFLTVDWLGTFFSLLAMEAQETLNSLGASIFIVWYVSDPPIHEQTLCYGYWSQSYGSIVIDGGTFVSHSIWLLRTRHLSASAKAAGKSFDDLPESEAYHVDVARQGSKPKECQREPSAQLIISNKSYLCGGVDIYE